MDALVWIGNVRLVEAIGIQLQTNNMYRARLGAYATTVAVVYV